MNLNGKQIISIIGAVLSVLMISTAQLTDLFGAGVAKTVVSVAVLGNLILQSVMAAITGTLSQDAQVKQVLEMPGVSRIAVNKQASPSLAAMAMNPDIDKISPTEGDRLAVAQTAKVA